ncbi:MAG: HAMP domain-containing histidine kinase [Zoogloeaceae bacterium]|jgi:signal transduction histidine kinase|nr:HAMP domain-containing histidine kinase [Zoogloeaceae bacterium]
MSEDTHDAEQIAALEHRITRLEKVNRALMDRVERSTSSFGDSYSLFTHNLTLQRHVEEQTRELQESNQQLHKALSDLQSATDQMIQNEKLAALGSLVAGIAHEVNTPLGIGVTAASHLEESAATLANTFAAGTMKKSDLTNFLATCQETVRIILSNLTRAANLIQSFKKIAVDQSSEDWQVIALESYLKDIIVSLTPKLRKTRIQACIHCPETLHFNTMPGALSQIITNLVSNSVAHAFEKDEEGTITITVKPKKQGITLIYEDDGKGISRENLPRIFDPFFTTRRGQGGSGLGLHLVYNIIRNLGGAINVNSVPGEGATFTINLPERGTESP